MLDADYDARIARCIGSRDAQRANKILGWLNGVAPPGEVPVAADLFEAA